MLKNQNFKENHLKYQISINLLCSVKLYTVTSAMTAMPCEGSTLTQVAVVKTWRSVITVPTQRFSAVEMFGRVK